MDNSLVDLIDLLYKFVKQSKTESSLHKEYNKQINYKSTILETSAKFNGGPGNQKLKVPHLSILKEGQKTNKGYYPVFLYDWKNNYLILAYGISINNEIIDSWNFHHITKPLKLNEVNNIGFISEKYGNSYLFIKYEQSEVEKLLNNDKGFKQKLFNNLCQILDEYTNKVNDTEMTLKILNNSDQILNDKKQIILYGPAGTGKTYNTKVIIEKHSKEKYQELKESGRVKFVTFHQSFAYEDFIEGIKPNLDNQNISYSIEDGIFKKSTINPIITDMARTEIQCNNVEESSRFWKISLGNSQISNEHERIYDYCVENNYIALGYGEEDTKNSMFKRFKDELKEGDYVFISKGNEKIKGFVKVTGEYEKIEEAPFQNCRKVEWLLHDLDEPVKNLFNKRFSQMSFYLLDINKPNINELNKILSGSINVEFSNNIIKDYLIDFYKKTKEDRKEFFKNSKPYYLIIDEINRGNISKIFGELITLLEASKRLGEADELTTTLPYSKEEFGIPPNLYIIGTMNTSDKSIAHLDIALRRRFGFVEMLPDYELINDDNCRKLLETLNERIKILLDKDHLIGHSFFMGKTSDDIPQIMQYEIIPLLEEYFYGDYEKIQLILGKCTTNLTCENKNLDDYDKDIYQYWFEKDKEFDTSLSNEKQKNTSEQSNEQQTNT